MQFTTLHKFGLPATENGIDTKSKQKISKIVIDTIHSYYVTLHLKRKKC